MRAIGIRAPGAPLQLMQLPAPQPASDEILVKVSASSINPVDGYIVAGTYGSGELKYPVVPGRDFCGVVERVGADASGFAPGDRVLGCWTKEAFRLGAWADFIALPADSAVAAWPAQLSSAQAAALPLAAATAQLAIDELSPASGEPLLIVGAGGAVGGYAVQLASRRGAHVIATAKPGEEPRLRSLGAAETIDYARLDVSATVRERHPDGVAALFDIVSDKPQLLALAEHVRDGGAVASARFAADKRVLSARGIKPINVLATGCGPEVLAPVLDLAQTGALQVLVSDVRPFEQLPELVAKFGRGGAGKIVVEIGG